MFLFKQTRVVTFTVIAAGLISGFFFVAYGNKVRTRLFSPLAYSYTAPTPTILPPSTEETITSDSPDGKKMLTLKKQREVNLVTYSLFASDIPPQATPPGLLLWSETKDARLKLSVPYNTWAPDDAYVFLQEENNNGFDYYVFFSMGGSFSKGEQYLRIRDLFTKARPEFTLTEVTGWAAPNLLIANTKTVEGTPGPSFWFDLTTQSFIQLGSRFN